MDAYTDILCMVVISSGSLHPPPPSFTSHKFIFIANLIFAYSKNCCSLNQNKHRFQAQMTNLLIKRVWLTKFRYIYFTAESCGTPRYCQWHPWMPVWKPQVYGFTLTCGMLKLPPPPIKMIFRMFLGVCKLMLISNKIK